MLECEDCGRICIEPELVDGDIVCPYCGSEKIRSLQEESDVKTI